MPKAGLYEYPFFDIDRVLEKLQQAYDVIKIDEMNREHFAEVLDMSPGGGGFSFLVSSLDVYGLIETGKGSISITELGKLALYAHGEEQKLAKSDAVFNVELFAELFNLYGSDASEEQILSFLRNKSGLDIVKARPRANKIFSVYSRNKMYFIKSSIPEKDDNIDNLKSSSIELSQNHNEDMFKFVSGKAILQIPKDDIESIRLFKMNLEYLEKQYKENSNRSEE